MANQVWGGGEGIKGRKEKEEPVASKAFLEFNFEIRFREKLEKKGLTAFLLLNQLTVFSFSWNSWQSIHT